MKNFFASILAVIITLLTKLASLKVFAFATGTTLGVLLAKPLNATFIHWGAYQLVLLIVFFTANQYQKWLFGLILKQNPRVT